MSYILSQPDCEYLVILHIHIFDERIAKNDYDIVFDDEENENDNGDKEDFIEDQAKDDFIDGEENEHENGHQVDFNTAYTSSVMIEDTHETNPLPKYGKIHIIHILMKYFKVKLLIVMLWNSKF